MTHSDTPSRIELPAQPEHLADRPVAAWREAVTIDSYLPEEPDRFPAFLETRVYQGSSGRVFPLPFHERISQSKVPHRWDAVHLENRWMRLLILPELGGRIHVAYDKVGEYDIFYRNNVIKPALVGLAGPWISGGVEFNWPQHHRPATFLPTDVTIEEEEDGSVTVWCSDHDPFARMKGMHGIRLRPDSSRIEARVRLYNRSETTQTFLWWANVAAAVNDDYQSFFPRDVHHVADHAKRAVVSFPEATTPYYGVDYQDRVTADDPAAARLDWYRNIPVPTSYMVMETGDEFFGGYDHGREVGFVHWADRSISPGKKQWTWGNAPFGWAWDANLTDGDGPYVELMAGVYTDNQPDFAYLAPGETKTFSQYWYPIRRIGPAAQASAELAASLRVGEDIVVGLHASETIIGAEVMVRTVTGELVHRAALDLTPDAPRTIELGNDRQHSETDLVVTVSSRGGERTILTIEPARGRATTPPSAVEPPQPPDVATVDELVQIATYLDQYRHATRSSVPYWNEVLVRDPGESRATAALGGQAYRDGRYIDAVELLRSSVERRTTWAPTPRHGDAHYLLGLALLRLDRRDDARDAFARASWDAAYAVAAEFALAREAARDHDDRRATDLLRHVLAADPNHLQARDLLSLLLRRSERRAEADAVLAETLRLDPLDAWALHLSGRVASADATTLLDVALEYAAAGFHTEALTALDEAESALSTRPIGQVNIGPLIAYHRAALLDRDGDREGAVTALRDASATDSTNTLPSRLDDIDALNRARELAPEDPLASALVGHWFYDRRRYDDAVAAWSVALANRPDPALASILERNLGIAAYNIHQDSARATEHYERALSSAPEDAKLWFESDQLAARTGVPARARLERLSAHPDAVAQRDDLTVTFARLLVEIGRAGEARDLLAARRFQPWEGGEGQVLDAWDRASFALADEALSAGAPTRAIAHLEDTLRPPQSLGEARHLLANVSEHHLRLGDSWAAAGDPERAAEHWRRAARSVSDFTRMAATPFSPQTIFAIVALRRLGLSDDADALTDALTSWVEEYAQRPAAIDYFATSLPTMLLFVDDPSVERDREVAEIRDQLSALRAGGYDAMISPYRGDDNSMATLRGSA
ncbi:DUF5107 domain-containing protein [Leifsonia sp. C5G2]|uniref:DUF5107 domain-containing protein n=1 Tax=Leifsonia sp. C5G2 TaxID=2735269 RepID=UPI0015849CD9|nr:DUF5107 domain-containing protein [Leifsonia sp. C5G2]NUU06169.1 DUF5107 domain-containing protein [Leifsonia sp. C5G2]